VTSLTIYENKAVSDILETVRNIPVISKDDYSFLVEKKEHLSQVAEKTHMWRTDIQKMSIISDAYYPTTHSKFHQAILEQKVQFEQAMYLAKDFELKKLEVEELECDLEELTDSKRDNIKKRKLQIEMQFKQFELKNMQTAMKYRMEEVKGWQKIQEELLDIMRKEGLSEDEIWNKSAGEVSTMFYQSLTNLQGIKSSTDGGERNNLIALAKFAVEQAKQLGIFEELKIKCNPEQSDSLNLISQLGGV